MLFIIPGTYYTLLLLADILCVLVVICHVGIYRSKVAEGFSAFNAVLVWRGHIPYPCRNVLCHRLYSTVHSLALCQSLWVSLKKSVLAKKKHTTEQSTNFRNNSWDVRLRIQSSGKVMLTMERGCAPDAYLLNCHSWTSHGCNISKIYNLPTNI